MNHLKPAALLGRGVDVMPLDAPTMRPGWAYAANLTPPELVVGYRLRRLRERLILALCLAGLVVALGFAFGFWRAHQADGAVQRAQERAETLQHQRQQYQSVIEMQAALAQTHAELATLLTGDVDVATLLDRIHAVIPSGVSIDATTVTVGNADAAAGDTTSAADNAAVAGTVTLHCAGTAINDAARFMDALTTISGIADVLPVSNMAVPGGTKFSLTFSLTDGLLTHRFAPQPTKGAR